MPWPVYKPPSGIPTKGLGWGGPASTPAGEIDRPRLANSFATRSWPQAGWSIAISTNRGFDLGGGAVLQDRLAAADLGQGELPAFVIHLLEPVEDSMRVDGGRKSVN